jgi:hypothetical protein
MAGAGSLPHLENQDVHVVAGALKKVFRDYYEPLVPYSLFKVILKADSSNFTTLHIIVLANISVLELRRVLNQMPPTNQRLLSVLVGHLHKVDPGVNSRHIILTMFSGVSARKRQSNVCKEPCLSVGCYHIAGARKWSWSQFCH